VEVIVVEVPVVEVAVAAREAVTAVERTRAAPTAGGHPTGKPAIGHEPAASGEPTDARTAEAPDVAAEATTGCVPHPTAEAATMSHPDGESRRRVQQQEQ
jgi:hypothetical protein